MFTPRAYVITALLLTVILLPAAGYAQSASISVGLALTSGTPIAGSNLTFEITANNEGPDSASSTDLTFAVPVDSTFVSLVTPAGWTCTPPLPPGGTGSTTCSKPTFAPGSEVFSLTVATSAASPPGTLITLSATIVSTTPDPDPDDNNNQLAVPLVWQSNLAVTKTGPANAFAGVIITYTIAITNPGPSNAADLTVTDTFAAPLRIVSVTAPGWTCVTPSGGSPGTVTCTNPQIPVGVANLTLQLDTAPSTAPTTVVNDVSVAASTDPAGPRLGSATTQITTSADLTITKGLTPAPPVAGQNITYTVTITQSGPSNAANVTLTDPLPGAVRFQSIAAPGFTCLTPPVGSTGTVTCTRAALPPGAYVITIQGTVPASTAAGTVISNTASVTSTTSDPTTPNTTTASATASTQADLSVTIADSPDPVAPGQNLTYQVVVTNGGPSDAANPSLSVVLDAALRFSSVAQPAGWTCTTPAVGASGTVACSAASIASGTSAPFTIVTFLAFGVPSGPGTTSLSTSATTNATTADPSSANNGASAVTAVVSADAIPTLSDLAFVALAGLLALVAVLKLRAARSRGV